MTPATQAPEMEPHPAPANVSIAVQLALLTGKVEQVIGDHERRITNLEQRRDGGATRAASITAPYIAGAAVIIALADKLRWN